jgi:hypothetical protein
MHVIVVPAGVLKGSCLLWRDQGLGEGATMLCLVGYCVPEDGGQSVMPTVQRASAGNHARDCWSGNAMLLTFMSALLLL